MAGELSEFSIRDSNSYRRVVLVIVISLYGLGYEITKPLAAQYIYHRVSSNYSLQKANGSAQDPYIGCGNTAVNASSPLYQEQQKAQDESSQWILYFSLATGIPCAITCVLLGSYSDSLGRKVMLVLSSCGTLCRGLCYVTVVYWNLPLYYLFIGYLLEGASGYYYGGMTAVYAYSSDITTPSSSRTRLIFITEVGKYFSKAIAELTTGVLIKSAGFIYPGFILIGSMVLNIFVIVVLLPETVQRRQTQSRKSLYAHLNAVMAFVARKNNPKSAKRGFYILGIMAFSVYILGVIGEDVVDKLYYMDSPLCWNSLQIGYFEAAQRFSCPIGSLAIVWILQRILPDDTIIHLIGLSEVTRQIAIAFANTSLIMYMSALLGVAHVGYGAMIRAILSKETSPDIQGALFAGFAMMEGFTSIGGNALFNFIYEITLPFMKGAVFLYAAGMTLLSMVLMWSLKIRYLRHGHRVHTQEKIIN